MADREMSDQLECSLVEEEIKYEIKVGDFVQLRTHFGDIYCEVSSVYEGGKSGSYLTYDKYGSRPHTEQWNRIDSIRRVVPAEMAMVVIAFKRERFQAKSGQFDPFYGFAPVGTPMRVKEESPWSRMRA